MTKTLFEHLNEIYTGNNTYFDNLTEEDIKSFNTYMLNRFISMNKNYLPVVDMIQQYNLSPRDLYLFYVNILPRKKVFAKYIKSSVTEKYPEKVIEILCKHYQASIEDARDCYDLLTKEQLKEICLLYGEKI